MGNVARFFCVALPFLLTLASLAALLVAGLAGVADKDLYLFEVNTTGLSINAADAAKLINARDAPPPAPGQTFHDHDLLKGTPTAGSSNNLTAANLNLANLYDVSLWGYCYTPQNGPRTCTQPAFNWAENTLNATKNNITTLASNTGVNVTLPSAVSDAITAFGTITKWTEIVFIIAYVALGIELFFGLFAECSRAFSCITFLVSLVATAAVCAAASLATAMAVVVVGTVEGTAKWYGVLAAFDTRFLIAVWVSVLFALAGGFFWLFTICCCKPEHRRYRNNNNRRSKHHDEAAEKLIPTGAYQPLREGEHAGEHTGFYNNAPQYGGPRYPQGGRSDLAYEPYSHARV
jgi:hypothetical protein